MKKTPVLAVGLGSFLILLLVLGLANRSFNKSLQPASEGLKVIEGERKLRGETVARALATQAVDHLLMSGGASDMLLKELVSRTKDENTLYLVIVDKKGKIRAHSDTTEISSKYAIPAGLSALGKEPVLAQFTTSKKWGDFYDVAVPVMVGRKKRRSKVGEVHVGIEAPKMSSPTPSVFPTFILPIAIGFVAILLVTSIGTRLLRRAIPPEVTDALTRLPQLKNEEAEISQRIAQKKEEALTLTKNVDQKKKDEVELSKRLEQRKKEAKELPKHSEELEKAVTAKKEEFAALNKRTEELRKEEQTLAERLKAAPPVSDEEMGKKVEAKRKEELELTQRIVAKRREEIAISQRIEAKRKEELLLTRKADALKKKLEAGGGA